MSVAVLSLCRKGLKVVVCAVLGLAITGKIMTGYRPSFGIAPAIYYGISMMEVVLVVMLWLRKWRLFATIGIVAMAAIGVVWTLVSSRACPCFGSWTLSVDQHRAVAALMGFAGCVLLWCEAPTYPHSSF